MIGFLQTLASFALVLGILVFVHEFGHFIVAKSFRIGVPVFSLGFGPRLFGFRRGGTDYRVSGVPLGGYVRLAGDESDETRTGAPEEFLSRPKRERFLVFVAGATFNLILAFLVGWLMFSIYGKDEIPLSEDYPRVAEVLAGSPVAVAGIERGDTVLSIGRKDARNPQTQVNEILLSPGAAKQVVLERGGARITARLVTPPDPKWHLGAHPGWLLLQASREPPVISHVEDGFPAQRADIRVGDKVLGIDDREPIDEIELRALLAASPGRGVVLKLQREGRKLEVPVTPRETGGRGQIGVGFLPAGLVHRDLSVAEAAGESYQWNLSMSATLFTTLAKLVRGEIGLRAFSGPIEIATASREAVKALPSFLSFLAFISLQLGIINLLPIPVLDGGHILILAVEATTRREFSEKLKERVMQTGFLFLLVFFAFVIYFDVVKTWFSS